MRVHHLDCGTLCPFPARLIDGQGSLFGRARMVCHCLLLETRVGLVLVETGIGTKDIDDPRGRLGRRFVRMVRPMLDPEQTALRHVARLGFAARDVRHIVLTHAHNDHAGGIADFPDATVHLYADEHAALAAPTDHERAIYRTRQWDHGPRWAPHTLQGDRWRGFEAVSAVPGLGDEVLLIPLPGHTRGHAAVAVRGDHGWLLHAGDAYFHRSQLAQGSDERAPRLLTWFQRQVDFDPVQRLHNLERLRQLKSEGDLKIFCAHDSVEFEATRAIRM
jgi:glyoxylase-like metal-dependent hydrolase (beta-lactamase superfamily II)